MASEDKFNYGQWNGENNNKQIKRISGKIVSVTKDNCYAVVSLSDGSNQMKFTNKTGEILSAGDNVWIEYSASFLSSRTGYIAHRNGKPKFTAYIRTIRQEEYNNLSSSDKALDILYVIVG